MIIQTQNNISDDLVPVEIEHGNCGSVDGIIDQNFFDEDEFPLKCQANDENLGPVLTALVVLTCFILSDMGVSCYMLFTGSLLMKLASIFIVIEGIIAIIACAFFARLKKCIIVLREIAHNF